MSIHSLDPQTALVALRIAELRGEASEAAVARRVPGRRTADRRWPQTVVAGLRETFLRATAGNAATTNRAGRNTAACATC